MYDSLLSAGTQSGAYGIIVLACDLMDQGQSLGPDSLRRCNKAYFEYKKLKDKGQEVTVLTAAGMADREKFPRQTRPIGEVMRDYLFYAGVASADALFVGTDATWGTRAEIQTCLNFMLGNRARFLWHDSNWHFTPDGRIDDQMNIFGTPPSEVRPILVTSRSHMPRIMFGAREIGRRECQRIESAHIVCRWQRASVPTHRWSNAWPEVYKLPAEILLSIPRFFSGNFVRA